MVSWSSAARCTADGKTSFDDWPMLTSSFGVHALAGERGDDLVRVHVRRRARTRSGRRRSETGRRARRSPTRSAAAAMRSAFSASRSPSSAFTRAAAALMRPEPARRRTAESARPKPGSSRRLCRVSTPQSSCVSSVAAMPPSLARLSGGLGTLRGVRPEHRGDEQADERKHQHRHGPQCLGPDGEISPLEEVEQRPDQKTRKSAMMARMRIRKSLRRAYLSRLDQAESPALRREVTQGAAN